MTAQAVPQGRAGAVPAARATFPNVVRSEWTKLWSVRSTPWTLLALVIVSLGLTALICWGASSGYDHASASDRADFDATSISLAGIAFGQLALAVLGIMTISSEYSTGGVRSTLTAVPRRMRVLGAKLVVFLAVALVAGTIVSFGSFFIGQLFFEPKGIAAHLGDAHVLRAVIGGGLYLAASGLFAFALGTLLRQTAGAITVAVAGLLVLPGLTNLLPGGWGETVQKAFTSNAGQQITSVMKPDNALGPWTGYIVFVAWGVIILAVGAVLMQRRDA